MDKIYLNQIVSHDRRIPYYNDGETAEIYVDERFMEYPCWDSEHMDFLRANQFHTLHLRGVRYGWWEVVRVA